MRVETSDRNSVGPRIRELRQEQGLTLDDLAQRIGISAGHLSRLERGAAAPSLSIGIAIARELSMTAQELAQSNRDQGGVNTQLVAALTEAGVALEIAAEIQRLISTTARQELLRILTGDVPTSR